MEKLADRLRKVANKIEAAEVTASVVTAGGTPESLCIYDGKRGEIELEMVSPFDGNSLTMDMIERMIDRNEKSGNNLLHAINTRTWKPESKVSTERGKLYVVTIFPYGSTKASIDEVEDQCKKQRIKLVDIS